MSDNPICEPAQTNTVLHQTTYNVDQKEISPNLKTEVQPLGGRVELRNKVNFSPTRRTEKNIGKMLAERQTEYAVESKHSKPEFFQAPLSPMTLKRLESKHQAAKIRQQFSSKLAIHSPDGLSPASSPNSSPSAIRRVIMKRGGDRRRFTLAKMRLVII